MRETHTFDKHKKLATSQYLLKEMSVAIGEPVRRQHTQAPNISQSSHEKGTLYFHLAMKRRRTVIVAQEKITARTLMTSRASLVLMWNSGEGSMVEDMIYQRDAQGEVLS
jgi:hypothetical protein